MSIFPFIDSTSTSTETNDELPMLKEYAYDFEKNELLLDEGGRTYMVEGNEALRIWIFKALFTERCHYTAYSFAFGSEIQDQVIGHSMNVEIVKLEIEYRFLSEEEYYNLIQQEENTEKVNENILISMGAQAELYEKLLATEENQLIIMNAVAELYEAKTGGN